MKKKIPTGDIILAIFAILLIISFFFWTIKQLDVPNNRYIFNIEEKHTFNLTPEQKNALIKPPLPEKKIIEWLESGKSKMSVSTYNGGLRIICNGYVDTGYTITAKTIAEYITNPKFEN